MDYIESSDSESDPELQVSENILKEFLLNFHSEVKLYPIHVILGGQRNEIGGRRRWSAQIT